jgi:hypothetical protein
MRQVGAFYIGMANVRRELNSSVFSGIHMQGRQKLHDLFEKLRDAMKSAYDVKPAILEG